VASPRGAYTPKSGPLAGQTFELRPGDSPTSPYTRYQSARAQALGYQDYRQERVTKLEIRARAAIQHIYPSYPPDRMNTVMSNANYRQMEDMSRFENMQDAYDWPDSEDVELFYH
jgi:hypothetical protein